MKSSALPIAGAILGLVLVVLSFVWGSLSPAKKSWTPEKSERLSELGSEANKLKFALIQAKNNPSMQAGENPATLQAKHDEIIAEYDTLHAELEAARDGPASTAKTLLWVGAASVLISGAFLLAAHGES